MKTQFLTSIMAICLAFFSCQKKTERCRLTRVEGETGKSIHSYNEDGELISSRYEKPDGEISQIAEYQYNSKGKLTNIFITRRLGETNKAREEEELQYDSDGRLARVVFYYLYDDGDKKLVGPPTTIMYSNGRVSGFKRESGNSAYEVKYLEFEKGNYHREETWETYDGNSEMTGHTLYTFDNHCNPSQDMWFNSIPRPSSISDNNILTTEVYRNGKLEQEMTNTYEYKRRMPVSVAISSSTGYNAENTVTYSCWE